MNNNKYLELTTIILVISIISVLTITMVAGQSDEYQTKSVGGWTVTWSMMSDYSNYKEYIVTVQNLNLTNRDFDLRLITDQFNNLRFDMELWEYKELEVEEWVSDNLCSIQLINGSNTSVCVDNGGYVTNQLGSWKKTQNPTRFKGNNSVFDDYGLMNIPKFGSKSKFDDYSNVITSDGTKTFRVVMKNFNPIIYNPIRLGFFEKTMSELFHPMVSSTLYEANFLIDNGTFSNIIQDANILNNSLTINGDLLSYYSFDLNNFTDFTGANPLTNTLTFSEDNGLINTSRGFEFDNSTFLRTGSFSLVNNTWTFNIWINPESTIAQQEIWNLENAALPGGGSNNKMNLNQQADNSAQWFGFEDSVAICVGVSLGGGDLGEGNFNMITIVNDGVTCRMYINGSEVDSAADNNRNLGLLNSFTVGATDGGIRIFDGILEELGVWTVALNTSQITELYNNGFGLQPNTTKSDVFTSLVFETGANQDKFTPFFNCTGTCSLDLTVEGENFFNVSSGVEQTLSIPTSDGNTTFNYSITLSGSSFTNFNLSFVNFTVAPVVNITVFGNISCIVFDTACFDGKIRCLLARDNVTGQILADTDASAFNVDCDSLNTGSGNIIFLFLVFGLVLLTFCFLFKIPIVGVMGGLVISILGIAILFTNVTLGMVLAMFGLGLTFLCAFTK